MDHIFSLTRRPTKVLNILKQVLSLNSHCISISSKNVVSFSTEVDIDDSSSRAWGSHVYVADLNCPWFVHKILSSSVSVSVLQWDLNGDLLLVGDENGTIKIYKPKDHLLNDWTLVLQTELSGEHILAAVFFHCGLKISLNSEKKDSVSYLEKFQHVKFSSSVKQFGGRPASGVLILTVTGMLGAILLPQPISQTPMIMATDSLGPNRVFIKTADICYGKNGHFLLAINSGSIISPVLCYKVQVRKIDEKCVITSQAVPSFFASDSGKETMNPRSEITFLKWLVREDADTLIVSANSDNGSCLQMWELHEKTLPVHTLLSGNETQHFNTVLWQYQAHFQYAHKVASLATSKLTVLNSLSCGYIAVAFSDNSIYCLYRDSLKVISSTTLNFNCRGSEDFSNKFLKLSTGIKQIDMSWLGHLLLVIDTEGHLHLFKLPPQIDSSTPFTVPYVTTMLEYCLVAGLDWLDLLLAMRPGMLDALCERFTESFSRQTSAIQQFFYGQYINIKISLFRLSSQGLNKVNDLTCLLMLNSISTAFKNLLRPSEVSSHEKSPADSLANVIAEGQSDVDKVLMHLEAKEFTVEPSALQSLQQLIQWVADLSLNLLVRLPDNRPSVAKSYELLKDMKALNTLRELLVLIRIWGLLRPACLPVFTKFDNSLDVLAHLFRLLSRLVQNLNEPDESLLDECCLLPSQVQIQQLQPLYNNRIALACPQLSQQSLPLHLEFQCEPECLTGTTDSCNSPWIDSIRHIYLGNKPGVVKQCVRCGGTAVINLCTRTAAIRAWDQRWLRSCRCGGLWRIHTYT